MNDLKKLFTNVQVLIYEENELRAFARVTIAAAIELTGLKVLEGKNGLYLAMPARERKVKGQVTHTPVYRPVNDQVYHALEDMVIEEYWRVKKAKQKKD